MNLKTTHPMTKEKLEKLVDDAVALHREVATKTEALKALKAALVREAGEHPKPMFPTNAAADAGPRSGPTAALRASAFRRPASSPRSRAKANRRSSATEIAGEHFRHLFTTVKSYHLVDDFRAQAASLLPAHKAVALLAVLESEVRAAREL